MESSGGRSSLGLTPESDTHLPFPFIFWVNNYDEGIRADHLQTVQPEMMPIAALVTVLTDVKFHGLWRLSIIRSYRHWARRVLRTRGLFSQLLLQLHVRPVITSS